METFPFSFEFRLGALLIAPVHLRVEELRPVIAAHRHSNASYEIHFTRAGRGTVSIDGETRTVESGTLYVTGPGVLHAQYTIETITEYCLYLRVERLRVERGDPFSTFADTTFWMGRDDGRIRSLMERLADERRTPRPAAEAMERALLTELIVEMTRLYAHSVPARSTWDEPMNRSATLPMIEDAFFYRYNTLTLKSLSDMLGLSERQTQRLLRERFNKTFSQKRTEARMAAAVQLLRDESLSVTEISERVGFSSIEHFSAAFHRSVGCPPREYRQRLRSERS